MRATMPDLTTRDIAEAALAKELRALGVERIRAMTVAEQHSHRLTFGDSGEPTLTLAGAAAIRALAIELHYLTRNR